MKFAKELERDLVPEWRAKYMNYKQAKKRLKTVERAFKTAHASPRPGTRHRALSATPKPGLTPAGQNVRPLTTSASSDHDGNGHVGSGFSPTDTHPSAEGTSQNVSKQHSYSSFASSLPAELPSFSLPAAAIADNATVETLGSPSSEGHTDDGGPKSTIEVAQLPTQRSGRSNSVASAARAVVSDVSKSALGKLTRVKTGNSPFTPGSVSSLQNEYLVARDGFLKYLSDELEKVNSFYMEKENEAIEKLPVIREQLHLMRDQRLQDLAATRANRKRPPGGKQQTSDGTEMTLATDGSDDGEGRLHQLRAAVQSLADKRIGKNSRALESMATPCVLNGRDPMNDYARRQTKTDVSYRAAKRKLKVALQEYHRSLELLKSYAILNRTAFRKINKKFDKLTHSKPTFQFFNTNVSKAHFVSSGLLDELSEDVEDLYARYFERGSHKIAVAKLRSKSAKSDQYSAIVLTNGLILGVGVMMVVEALLNAFLMMREEDEGSDSESNTAAEIRYLLQLYGGYALITLLALAFCFACWVWTVAKINYTFIFEFNPRTRLVWQELMAIPSLFVFLLGLFSWVNFSSWASEDLFMWYPVILICTSVLIMFFPFNVWFPRARKWFLTACWRLFWSGLYPVEFRDFFLGDMLCSLVYSMGNISLFFCLYSTNWDDPPQCNSNHSRLMGFFTALPAIWRAIQCLRRYRDTRNAFPHLANFGKYTFTIVSAMALSLYRISRSPQDRAAYIVFSVISTFYSTIWDLLMDWSLLDFGSSNFLLRDTLGYKKTWPYYLAMFIDPILRSTWIFYAIFPLDIQHSALLSFVIALAEVCRRGMWVIFRVENEHCSNVGRFRASRDVPLPYSVHESRSSSQEPDKSGTSTSEAETRRPSETTAIEPTEIGSSCRARIRAGKAPSKSTSGIAEFSPIIRTLSHVAHHLHAAHTEDFQRRPDNTDTMDKPDDDDNEDSEDEGLHTHGNTTPLTTDDDRPAPMDRKKAGSSSHRATDQTAPAHSSVPAGSSTPHSTPTLNPDSASGPSDSDEAPSRRTRSRRYFRRRPPMHPLSPHIEASETESPTAER